MTVAKIPKLNPNDLANYVTYNPETGVLRRARTSGYRGQHKIGEIVGWRTKFGYRYVKLDGESIMAHRLAFAIMTGRWPEDEIDHINGKRDDNRWENLRAATRTENRWNTDKRKDNKSGFKGVHAHGDKWRAAIQHNKQRIDLGIFDTAQQASDAYVKRQNELHKEFARVGIEAKQRLKRTNLLDSGLDVEWQSWPHGEERPLLWANGCVDATAEFFDQIASWYPRFSVRVCQDQPEAVLRGRRLIEVLQEYC